MLRLVQYDRNTVGQDYFVGDVHGERGQVLDALDNRNFDKRVDRLFGAGDLCDRGADSLGVARMLREPWFTSVAGNHEVMFRQMYHNQYVAQQPDLEYAEWYRHHGGDWFFYLPPHEARLIADHFASLPDIIRVGDIAVLHGDTWDEDAKQSITFDHLVTRGDQHKTKWKRKLANLLKEGVTEDEFRFTVTGVAAVVLGHAPQKEVMVRGNHVFLDTGAGKTDKKGHPRGHVTVMSYDEIIELMSVTPRDQPRLGVLR